MARSADNYRELFKALLPPGEAFSRSPGTLLDKTLGALAVEPARLDQRANVLIDEVIPSTTNELLPDWERVAGLPGDCIHELQTVQERRNALLVKLGRVGNQSPQYFIDVAAALGFPVSVVEYKDYPEEHVGDGNEDWKHTWRIDAPATNIKYFRAGVSVAGERLRSWGNEQLECTINRIKPAHTVLLFGYS
jgi:uncharacterized protein YmfQ (DUF2313 family)